jgi:acetyl-CoA acetyltransferase
MSNNANDVVIVGHARTPFDKFGGVCRSIPSAKLAEWTIRELLKRTGLEAEVIDDVNLGMCHCIYVIITPVHPIKSQPWIRR